MLRTNRDLEAPGYDSVTALYVEFPSFAASNCHGDDLPAGPR
jgi:hypothetical protein